jgi:type VI secretion system protein ImpH
VSEATLGEPVGAARVVRAFTTADPASPLADLAADPFGFDFFQAVRLIAVAAAGPQASRSGVVRAAGAGPLPYEEFVRFRAHVGHTFSASAINAFVATRSETESAGARPLPVTLPVPEMTVTFMSLAGTNAVLPWHYTQLLIDRIREKDYGLRDFLDLFHHRLIAQFYRAWQKCHFFVGYESVRQASDTDADRFSQMLFSLVGLGSPGLRGREVFSDDVFAHYAGHFSRCPRSATALTRLVSDFFQLPTEIRQFQGQWMWLRREDQTQLRTGGNNRLGSSAIAGSRVWGIENRFRVRLTVSRYDDFTAFMPDGASFVAFGQLVRFFAGPSFDFDLQLVLSGEAVPRCRLGGSGDQRLGWNTWLFSGPAGHDVEDAVFRCEGMPSH